MLCCVMQVSTPQHTFLPIKYLLAPSQFFFSWVHGLWQSVRQGGRKKKKREKATQASYSGFTLKINKKPQQQKTMNNKSNNTYTSTENPLSPWAIIFCYLPTILRHLKPAQAKLCTINTRPTIINHRQKGKKRSKPDKKVSRYKKGQKKW